MTYCKWCQSEECAKDSPAYTWAEILEMERDAATYERAQAYVRTMFPGVPEEE